MTQKVLNNHWHGSPVKVQGLRLVCYWTTSHSYQSTCAFQTCLPLQTEIFLFWSKIMVLISSHAWPAHGGKGMKIWSSTPCKYQRPTHAKPSRTTRPPCRISIVNPATIHLSSHHQLNTPLPYLYPDNPTRHTPPHHSIYTSVPTSTSCPRMNATLPNGTQSGVLDQEQSNTTTSFCGMNESSKYQLHFFILRPETSSKQEE